MLFTDAKGAGDMDRINHRDSMDNFYEPITVARLNQYTDKVAELDALLDKKQKIQAKLDGLKGVDYSKQKITTGNVQNTSNQEYYAMKLEKVNQEIDKLKYKCFGVYGLLEEHKVIKTQIGRIQGGKESWKYRKILVLRFLEKWKWIEIIKDFYGREKDFEEQKYSKYWDKMMDWRKSALRKLEQVSSTPEEVSALKRIQKIKNFCKKELKENLTPNKDEFIKKLLLKLK